MKKLFCFFLLALLLSCGDNAETSTNEIQNIKDSIETQENIETEVSEDFEELAFDGQLNGKYPIFMQLNKVGASIYGEMLYKKIGVPISVSGSESNGKWTLSERGENDEITGVYEGSFRNKTFKGTWANPKNGKSMPFTLSVSNETINKYKNEKVSDKNAIIARKYSDGVSTFTFEKVSETEYLFSFFGTWTYNETTHTGELEDVAIWKDGKLYYHGQQKDGLENCSFIATFKGDKMFVESESNDIDCGFGANVNLGTEYTK